MAVFAYTSPIIFECPEATLKWLLFPDANIKYDKRSSVLHVVVNFDTRVTGNVNTDALAKLYAPSSCYIDIATRSHLSTLPTYRILTNKVEVKGRLRDDGLNSMLRGGYLDLNFIIYKTIKDNTGRRIA